MGDIDIRRYRKEFRLRDRGWLSGLGFAKLLPILGLVAFTNFEFWGRVNLLWERGNYQTLVPFLAIWSVALAAVLVVSIHPKLWIRVLWGALIALSSAAAFGYHLASQSQLGVLDVVSLWNARHEIDRAAELYGQTIWVAAGVFLAWFALIVVPVPVANLRARHWLAWLAPLPLVPILLIAGVAWMKNGTGTQSLPSQFTPLSVAGLVGLKISTTDMPMRQSVSWQPGPALTRNIVMLVDESVRADYIDLAPNNPFTPFIAGLSDKFVNFGPAASGGNCSNYANAILRLAIARKNNIANANTSPSLFEYAKRAGYRTVFIDAQAGNITDGNLMQNFMTVAERGYIDAFHALRGIDAAQADDELTRIVAKELRSGQPTFIYANKNGAHFPYDHDYPKSAATFHPTISEENGDTLVSRIASYRNAIAWSVDRIMQQIFMSADLSATTLVYTSDHGQLIEPGKFTHCQVEDPDPRMHLVPLMVHSPDREIRAGLEQGAVLLAGKSSHFQIAPTILSLMGYAKADIDTVYDESLFAGTPHAPATTSGDIFRLFGNEVNWNPVDLGRSYLEPFKPELVPASSAANSLAGGRG